MNRKEIEKFILSPESGINSKFLEPISDGKMEVMFREIACQLADLNEHLRATQLSRRDQIALAIANGYASNPSLNEIYWHDAYKEADAMIAASGEGNAPSKS